MRWCVCGPTQNKNKWWSEKDVRNDCFKAVDNEQLEERWNIVGLKCLCDYLKWLKNSDQWAKSEEEIIVVWCMDECVILKSSGGWTTCSKFLIVYESEL